MKKIRAIRGMRDVLPEETGLWRHVETVVKAVVEGYGYEEIRLPIVEFTDLFQRSVGAATDIVDKEMYSFLDRGDDSLSLRPEGTAGCVRACEENGMLYNQTQRLWYAGPMFRYERPQKGRYRQFEQIGVEAFGFEGPDVDAEHILMTADMWRRLGVIDALTLELNSLGSLEARGRYREALVAYLRQHEHHLDQESRDRLDRNPLRILDSKDAGTQAVLEQAPVMLDFLDEASAEHFAGLKALLEAQDLDYVVNPRIVRGLDYYTRTVFEWTTTELGAQGAVCGGGRYDGLVEQLGGRPTPATGFAIGMDRLVLLVETTQQGPVVTPIDVYFVVADEGLIGRAFELSRRLRDAFPTIKLRMHCGGGRFRNQMRRADQSGAKVALILGEDEARENRVSVKPLRGKGEQLTLDYEGLERYIEGTIDRSTGE
jgi:histidyl-tRNA synthetase